MSHAIFAQGVQGMLQCTWKLHLATPMIVRGDRSFVWQHSKEDKERGHDVRFDWRGKKSSNNKKENEIRDLRCDIFVKDAQLFCEYQIPSSSIRGRLRNWCITHLVPPQHWGLFEFVSKDDSDENAQAKQLHIENCIKVLENTRGWATIGRLFGLPIDSSKDTEKFEQWINASPMMITSKIISEQKCNTPDLQGAWRRHGNDYGPSNAARHIKIRNPIDRITCGSKDRGLHSMLEFSTKNVVEITIKIKNPVPHDLGLVSIWEREINDGMLRFGGMSSVGRGRVTIEEQSHEIFSTKKYFNDYFKDYQGYLSQYCSQKDILSGLWIQASTKWENDSRNAFEKALQKTLGEE